MIERGVCLGGWTLCVVVQLALYRLAAFDGEHPLRFGEIDQVSGHLVGDVLVRLQVFGLHLGHGALHHVPVLQGQERYEEVHQVLVDQAGVPQAACRERGRDAAGEKSSFSSILPDVQMYNRSRNTITSYY